MRIGKLAAAAIVLGIGWQQKEVIEPHLGSLRDLGPVSRTFLEMRSYRTGLMAYRQKNGGATPPDVSEWLELNYDRGARPASQDVFGTPYLVERGETRNSMLLRSCGPDARCHTQDDLVVSLDYEATTGP